MVEADGVGEVGQPYDVALGVVEQLWRDEEGRLPAVPGGGAAEVRGDEGGRADGGAPWPGDRPEPQEGLHRQAGEQLEHHLIWHLAGELAAAACCRLLAVVAVASPLDDVFLSAIRLLRRGGSPPLSGPTTLVVVVVLLRCLLLLLLLAFFKSMDGEEEDEASVRIKFITCALIGLI